MSYLLILLVYLKVEVSLSDTLFLIRSGIFMKAKHRARFPFDLYNRIFEKEHNFHPVLLLKEAASGRGRLHSRTSLWYSLSSKDRVVDGNTTSKFVY